VNTVVNLRVLEKTGNFLTGIVICKDMALWNLFMQSAI
jgi:hypothetical protein